MLRDVQTVRLFLVVESVAFVTAASVHFGLLLHGHEHLKAGTAESVIGGALFLGLVLTAFRPASTRAVGLAAQGFALLGTLVGISTIAIGVGPRTVADITFHLGIVIVLVFGVIATVHVKNRAAVGETF
jgi:hypothetical protein